MKYEVDIASNGMMFITYFMEISQFVQKLNGDTFSWNGSHNSTHSLLSLMQLCPQSLPNLK
jgi:hypothetical protein